MQRQTSRRTLSSIRHHFRFAHRALQPTIPPATLVIFCFIILLLQCFGLAGSKALSRSFPHSYRSLHEVFFIFDLTSFDDLDGDMHGTFCHCTYLVRPVVVRQNEDRCGVGRTPKVGTWAVVHFVVDYVRDVYVHYRSLASYPARSCQKCGVVVP